MDYKAVQNLYKDNWIVFNDILEVDATFLAPFVQERVLTRPQEEKILKKLQLSSIDAKHEFMHIISSRGDSGRKVFWESLVKTNQFALADILFPERAPSDILKRMESGATARYADGNVTPPDSPTSRSSAVTETEQNRNIPGSAVDHGQTRDSDSSTISTLSANRLVPPDDASSVGRDPQPDHNPLQPNSTLEHGDQALPARPEIELDKVARRHSRFDDGELSSPVQPIINDELVLTTDEDVKKLFEHSGVYRMSTGKRGRALIINNEEFEEKVNKDQEDLDYRVGSDVDCKNIRTVLEKLQFIVTVKLDRTAEQIRTDIANETERKDHTDYGMFVLVILSHGDRDIVYGADGRKIASDTIIDLLKSHKFVGMKGKPKWIIQQTCSGVKTDQVQADTRPAGVLASEPAFKPVQSTSNLSDFYILKSSFPGYMSLRDPKYGSYLIRDLVKVLYKYAAHQDLQSITTEVRKRVLDRSKAGNHDYGTQTVFDSTTLLNKIYLFPGYNPESSG